MMGDLWHAHSLLHHGKSAIESHGRDDLQFCENSLNENLQRVVWPYIKWYTNKPSASFMKDRDNVSHGLYEVM